VNIKKVACRRCCPTGWLDEWSSAKMVSTAEPRKSGGVQRKMCLSVARSPV